MSEQVETEPSALPPTVEGGEDMHIHKPKAAHGLREFLSEISVIVVGILIALALEQAVEAAHWWERVAEAKASIHRELAYAVVFGQERRAWHDCADSYLAELADAIVASPAKWRPRPSTYCGFPRQYVYRSPSRPWPTEVWRTLEADGTVTHFVGHYRQQAPFVFNFMQIIHNDNDDEVRLGPELDPLGYPLVLTPDTRLVFLKTIAELRDRNDRLKLLTEQMDSQIADLGETPTAAELKRWRAEVPSLFVGPGVVLNSWKAR